MTTARDGDGRGEAWKTLLWLGFGRRQEAGAWACARGRLASAASGGAEAAVACARAPGRFWVRGAAGQHQLEHCTLACEFALGKVTGVRRCW